MAVPPIRVSGTSTGFGQWHAAKIRPVNTAANHWRRDERKHAVVHERVQEHLLEDAEREVTPEAMPGDQVWRQVQWRPEASSNRNQANNHRAENEYGLAGRGPKIICAPA